MTPALKQLQKKAQQELVPRRVLVYLIGSLGDTLAALPALYGLRKCYPRAIIGMMSDAQAGPLRVNPRDVLGGTGLVDEFHTYPASWSWRHPMRKLIGMVSLYRVVNRFAPEVLVYLPNVFSGDPRIGRDILFFRLAGVRRILGLSNLPVHPGPRVNHATPRLPKLSELYLARLQSDLPGLRLVPEDWTGLRELISLRGQGEFEQWFAGNGSGAGRCWIAFGIGSKMPAKRWPLSRYVEVARELIRRFNIWPVVFGSADERELALTFVRAVGRGCVAAGQLSVQGAAAALARCKLYVGNDTGTMHLAATVGVPCVAIFSARDYPGLWEPIGDNHTILRHDPECTLCQREVCNVPGHPCLSAILPSEVIDACSKYLMTTS